MGWDHDGPQNLARHLAHHPPWCCPSTAPLLVLHPSTLRCSPRTLDVECAELGQQRDLSGDCAFDVVVLEIQPGHPAGIIAGDAVPLADRFVPLEPVRILPPLRGRRRRASPRWQRPQRAWSEPPGLVICRAIDPAQQRGVGLGCEKVRPTVVDLDDARWRNRWPLRAP